MLVLDFGGMPFGAVDSLLCGELAVRGVRDYDVEISLGDKTRRFDHAADTVNGLSHLDGRQCLTVSEEFDVAGENDSDKEKTVGNGTYNAPLYVDAGRHGGHHHLVGADRGADSGCVRLSCADALPFQERRTHAPRSDTQHNTRTQDPDIGGIRRGRLASELRADGVRSGRAARVYRYHAAGAAAAAAMVDRILRMSVEESDAFTLSAEECRAGDLVEEAVRPHRMTADKSVRIETDVEEGLTLRCDRFHLVNALGNLVDNAVKYSGDEVNITVRAAADGGNVIFEVDDDGIGMARGEAERVFDKFYRIPTGDLHAVKGFGLGLYYVRTVAERHGGSARAESGGTGRGSKFFIIIPRYGRE